jgi:hypothetical protein
MPGPQIADKFPLVFTLQELGHESLVQELIIAIQRVHPSAGCQYCGRAFGIPASVLTAILIGAFLIQGLVPGPNMLIPEAKKLASAMASKSPLALRLAKAAINEGFELPLHAGLAIEWKYFHEVTNSEDNAEGIRAFVEKRTPVFKGR